MKNPRTFFALCALGLSLTNCTASAPAGAFPDTIGRYRLKNVDHQGGPFQARSWHPATYSIAGGVDGKEIFYGLAVHNSAEAARQEQVTNIFCSRTQNAENAASDIGVVRDRKLEIIKEDKLKDKSGQEVGGLTVCREEMKGTTPGVLLNNYQYTVVFNRGERVVVLNGRARSSEDKQVPLSELLAFMRALPGTTDVDFDGAKLDGLPGAAVTEVASASDVAKLAPPQRPAPAPYLKGKALIVEDVDGDGKFYFPTKQERYGLGQSQLAESNDDAQSVIQVLCQSGDKIGYYVTKDAARRKIPAFASRCVVTIIDKTIPAVIAQKAFTNREVPMFEEEKVFTEGDQEYVVPLPFTEVANFLKSMPVR